MADLSDYQSTSGEYSFSKGPKSIYNGQGDENLFQLVLNVPQTDDDDEWGGTQRIADERISDKIASLVRSVAGPTGVLSPSDNGLESDFNAFKGFLDITVPKLELGDIVVNGNTNIIDLGNSASLNSSALTLANSFVINSTSTRGLLQYTNSSLKLYDDGATRYVDITVLGTTYQFRNDLLTIPAKDSNFTGTGTTTLTGNLVVNGTATFSGGTSGGGALTGTTLTLTAASINLAGLITGTGLTVGTSGTITCGTANVRTSLTVGNTSNEYVKTESGKTTFYDASANARVEIDQNIKISPPSGNKFVELQYDRIRLAENVNENTITETGITIQAASATNSLSTAGMWVENISSGDYIKLWTNDCEIKGPTVKLSSTASNKFVELQYDRIRLAENVNKNTITETGITVQSASATNSLTTAGMWAENTASGDYIKLWTNDCEIKGPTIKVIDTSNIYVTIDGDEIFLRNNNTGNLAKIFPNYISFEQGGSPITTIGANGVQFKGPLFEVENATIKVIDSSDIYVTIDGDEIFLRNDSASPTQLTKIISGAIQFLQGGSAITTIGTNGAQFKGPAFEVENSNIKVISTSDLYSELSWGSLEIINTAGSPDLSSKIGAGLLEIKQNTSIVHQMNNSILYTSVSDVRFPNLPTSDSGLLTGQLWRDGTDVKVKT